MDTDQGGFASGNTALDEEFSRLRAEYLKMVNYAATSARRFCELERSAPEFDGQMIRNGLVASHVRKTLSAFSAALAAEERQRLAVSLADQKAAEKEAKKKRAEEARAAAEALKAIKKQRAAEAKAAAQAQAAAKRIAKLRMTIERHRQRSLAAVAALAGIMDRAAQHVEKTADEDRALAKELLDQSDHEVADQLRAMIERLEQQAGCTPCLGEPNATTRAAMEEARAMAALAPRPDGF